MSILERIETWLYERRMARAKSRDARRPIFARYMVRHRDRFEDEWDGALDWFLQRALLLQAAQDDLAPPFGRLAGLLTSATLNLRLSIQRHDSRSSRQLLLCALILHHVGLPMAMAVAEVPRDAVHKALRQEHEDFLRFVAGYFSDLSDELSSFFATAETLAKEMPDTLRTVLDEP